MAKRKTPKRTVKRQTPKRPAKRKGSGRSVKRKPSRRLLKFALAGIACAIIVGGFYTAYLDYRIRSQFEGKRWELPARVFARPLELYTGKPLTRNALIQELKLLRYRQSADIATPGEYTLRGDTVLIHSRGFPFWDGNEPEREIRIEFKDERIAAVTSQGDNQDPGLFRMEPVPIANIYPAHNEDRVLVRLDEVPPLLVNALLATEDREFYEHYGIDPKALTRAVVANVRAGRTVQGGSTLTQQLVKNYFLTNERTLWRKFNEAIMALLLEWHYSKDDILQAYLNEVFLGQDGKRAIHGFGMASQFYFERRLNELTQEQIALLVAMVKGPSYYNPRKHLDRARARRNLVLSLLDEQDHLKAAAIARAKAQPLGVSEKAPSGVSPFPAFIQLVRQQLQRYYRDDDLRSEGLVIFTTLDPLAQIRAERAMVDRLTRLERTRGLPRKSLQSAVVVTSVDSGEILALVGGRDPQFSGYNRAIDARRPIGSLIKPVVYLTALLQPDDYTLTTWLEDEPLTVRLSDDKVWSPENYDHQSHGRVMLRDALVHSYNVPTARLGLALGVDKVVNNLYRLGVKREIPYYPSVLLGAVELSPLEVSQVYQAIAAGGYKVPLLAIREVMTSDGVPLNRYSLKLERVADSASVYLLTAALHEVTRQGTAKRLQHLLPADLKVAGKTGTTDALRDSWFAGFSGDHLAVVWVGRDDNQPTGLTGSSGALTVWADIMQDIPTRSLDVPMPADTEWQLIDKQTGQLAAEYCEEAVWMPFISGSAPDVFSSCVNESRGVVNKTFRWFKGLLN